jgi:hypothetical protein
VTVSGISESPEFNGRTRDLSAEGVFLYLGQNGLPVGSDIELEIDLTVDPNRSVLPTPQATSIRGKGTITRRENDGLAIVFDRQLQFS